MGDAILPYISSNNNASFTIKFTQKELVAMPDDPATYTCPGQIIMVVFEYSSNAVIGETLIRLGVIGPGGNIRPSDGGFSISCTSTRLKITRSGTYGIHVNTSIIYYI